MDPTVHPAGGYTIPDTDTFIYYQSNNSTGGGNGILTLPHATVAGKRVMAIPVNASNSATRIQVVAQSGDTIFDQTPGGQTTLATVGPVMLFSDGSHRWYVIATQ
jgi:hypothetical protein